MLSWFHSKIFVLNPKQFFFNSNWRSENLIGIYLPLPNCTELGRFMCRCVGGSVRDRYSSFNRLNGFTCNRISELQKLHLSLDELLAKKSLHVFIACSVYLWCFMINPYSILISLNVAKQIPNHAHSDWIIHMLLYYLIKSAHASIYIYPNTIQIRIWYISPTNFIRIDSHPNSSNIILWYVVVALWVNNENNYIHICTFTVFVGWTTCFT